MLEYTNHNIIMRRLINTTTINKEVERCVKSIGEDLIKRAEDISRDLENVHSISINSIIENGTIINYDVTKNYTTGDYIHYYDLEGDEENE